MSLEGVSVVKKHINVLFHSLFSQKMFGKLFASIVPRVKAQEEQEVEEVELVDPQTELRVRILTAFLIFM